MKSIRKRIDFFLIGFDFCLTIFICGLLTTMMMMSLILQKNLNGSIN